MVVEGCDERLGCDGIVQRAEIIVACCFTGSRRAGEDLAEKK